MYDAPNARHRKVTCADCRLLCHMPLKQQHVCTAQLSMLTLFGGHLSDVQAVQQLYDGLRSGNRLCNWQR